MTPTQIERILRCGKPVAGKWKPEILFLLSDGPLRRYELLRKLPGAAPTEISRQLHALKEDGLIHRNALSRRPPQAVEYGLTEPGLRFIRFFSAAAETDASLPQVAEGDMPDFSVFRRMLSSRWMLQILETAAVPRRFGSIQACFEGLSRGVLASQLRELVRMGLLCQTDYHSFPPRVEYQISDAGRHLTDILAALPGYIQQKTDQP